MKELELLAPAGDQESLIAAIQNGANAIYLGGTLFNARAFAKNFDMDQLQWAVQYAHLRNVKIYVTVNTLYKDDEFEQLIQYIDQLYELQVDALIIQDIGLFRIVKQRYPDFEIHISTQASVMNLYGVQYFEKMGANRVVLARENSLEEIRHICRNTTLDIEVFVHGALCVCYSGQCLMSSFIGKRSGNRGACAQPCRLQYRLVKDNEILENKVPFLLSPRDLMTIENIGELVDAGVTSFKVEGRMKKPEYVASVIKAYRKAIDAYLNREKDNFDEEIYLMKSMFNRDYTKGYIFQDEKIVSGDYSGNKGVLIGQVVGYNKNQKRVIVKLNDLLCQGDSVVFESIDKGRPINKLYIKNKLVNKAQKGDIVEIEFDFYVKEGNVRKTINTDVIKKLQKTYQEHEIQLPIVMNFQAHINQQAKLSIQYKDIFIYKNSDCLVEKAIKTPLSKERIIEQLSKLGNTCFQPQRIDLNIDENITIPIKQLNQLRRDCIKELTTQLEDKKVHSSYKNDIQPLVQVKSTDFQKFHILVSNIEQLENALKNPSLKYIYYPFDNHAVEVFKMYQKYNKLFCLFIPRIMKDEEIKSIKESSIYTKIDTLLVNDYGSYYAFSDKNRVLGTGFNIYNSYACQHFHESKVLSLEMSQSQLRSLKADRNDCIVQIYGKIENMISEYCPISQYYFGFQNKNCQLCKHAKFSLLDRKGETFDLMMDEKCRMHLLNCRALYYDKFNKLDFSQFFIHFTNEDIETMELVINNLINHANIQNKDEIKDKIQTTYGYFKE